MSIHPATRHLIKLTTHPSNFGVDPEPTDWYNRDPVKRGPVIATVSKPGMRNAIGSHSGTYSVYRAVALAVQAAPANFKPNYTNTLPPEPVGPFEAWFTPGKIVSLDPWGHIPQQTFKDKIDSGKIDLRPTIAMTKSHLDLPEIVTAVQNGTIKPDGKVVLAEGALFTSKAAIEPVWHLPEIAKRFGVDETQLRRIIYEQTGGMFPELVTRPDLKLFLPPINGVTVYIIGSVASIPDETKPLVVRLHDESGDSDIFGADGSTCRPYLVHGLFECIRAAQAGGAGMIVYSRQEGNALGEVSKFLVQNARTKLGDSVDNFFEQQLRVAGARDARHFELSPDVLHWFGVTKIDKFVSTSAAKAEALEAAGITIVERTGLPQKYVPERAQVESLARSASQSEDGPGSPAKKQKRKKSPAGSPTRMALPAAGAAEQHLRRVVLTTHPAQYSVDPVKIDWGNADPAKRGAVVATLLAPELRNAIGTHNGPYAVHRSIAVAKEEMDPKRVKDLRNCEPSVQIGPFPSWNDPDKIVAMDPWGHMTGFAGGPSVSGDKGKVHPSIAVSSGTLKLAEVAEAMAAGRLKPDGKVLKADGTFCVTKCAIEPVWWLPGIAKRFKLSESVLRQKLFEHTGGMFPELVTRTDLNVFLPPIGGCTAYIMGDPATIPQEDKQLTVRVHDECNGSDVFGSDICTCRPYLLHGIEECIRAAQEGGAGLIVYNRKEGRALGEVTKFMVYNARKRQEGGDSAQTYFKRTEDIAGVQDMRFQELMPDPLLWLGVTKIDRFISMSDMKYDSVTGLGIKIVERVDIPEELIPADAKVEIDAKMYAGYYSGNKDVKTFEQLNSTIGRAY